jgi:putative GTP pyrophosphokinase
MTKKAQFEELLKLYDDKKHDLEIFMDGVESYIGKHPILIRSDRRLVHTCKKRLKEREHVREKIIRKNGDGRRICKETFFQEITDLAGVRILHLYQGDFADIDRVIRQKVTDGDWYLSEQPKAYTWDPEAVAFFQKFELVVSEKETSYTSVHYLVRPRHDSPLCCEVQVRTLFEEIWGEVDHQLNYPTPSGNIACKEQLRVLSKIIGAGSRLLDSIKRVQESPGIPQ